MTLLKKAARVNKKMAQQHRSAGDAAKHAVEFVRRAQREWPRAQLSCAFDIDDTLLHDDGSGNISANSPIVNLMKWCHLQGLRVHLITARPSSSLGGPR